MRGPRDLHILSRDIAISIEISQCLQSRLIIAAATEAASCLITTRGRLAFHRGAQERKLRRKGERERERGRPRTIKPFCRKNSRYNAVPFVLSSFRPLSALTPTACRFSFNARFFLLARFHPRFSRVYSEASVASTLLRLGTTNEQ